MPSISSNLAHHPWSRGKNTTGQLRDELLNIEIFDIATINSGEEKEFRPLPIPTPSGKYTAPFVFIYYHWRCNEAEILGGGNIEDAVPDAVPSEFREFMTVEEGGSSDAVVEGSTKYTMDSPAACFGNYDGDEDCRADDCDDIRAACAAEAGYEQNAAGEFVKKVKKKK